MRLTLNDYQRKTFWKSIPFRSLLILLIAIFFTFSSIGFIADLWNGGRYSIKYLIIIVSYSGILGAGYAYAAMRNWKLIPVLLVVQFSLAFFDVEKILFIHSGEDLSVNPILKGRLILDGIGIFSVIIAGYVFFIIFIVREGVRQVRLKTEIELARKMHDILVPTVEFQNEHLIIYGRSFPASEVGGDLLDVYSASGVITCYTADVSGHGIPASLLMGMFKSAMRSTLQKNLSLAESINSVNQTIYPLKKPSMFLTVAAMRFSTDKSAEFTVAGHLPILHYQSQTNTVQQLTMKQIPVSVKPDYIFKTGNVKVTSGDYFLFITDGLSEVMNDRGEEFGIKRFENILLEKLDKPIEQIFEIIISQIEQFGTKRDDQTLMIIRCL